MHINQEQKSQTTHLKMNKMQELADSQVGKREACGEGGAGIIQRSNKHMIILSLST